jgi:hypothetical protein
MLSMALYCDLDFKRAMAEAEGALALARRIGHRRAEIVAPHGSFMARFYGGESDDLRSIAEEALRLPRVLGAQRFEAEAMAFLTMLDLAEGERGAALARVEEALALARASGLAYWGPIILALLAWATPDARARARAIEEGHALLDAGSLSHNHFFFGQWAIEGALDKGLWDEAAAEADRLARFCAREPNPWMEFVVARGRALACFGRGQREAALKAQLSGLLALAGRTSLGPGRRELEQALAAME